MNTLKVIGDLTRCYPQREHEALDAVRQFCIARQIPNQDVILIGRVDQRHIVNRFAAQWCDAQSVLEGANVVSSLLAQISRSGTHQQVAVVSYNGATLKGASQWGMVNGLQVQTNSFTNLNSGVSTVGPCAVGKPKSWTFDHVIGEEQAVESLREALLRNGCTSQQNGIRQTDLRPLLAAQDRRFRREGTALETRTTGMIGTLIKRAEARGVVCVNWAQSPNPAVWLCDGVGTSEPVNQATAATVATMTVSEPNSQPPASCVASDGRAASTPLIPTASLTDRVAGEAKKDAEPYYRSKEMERLVRKHKMGPYAVCRLAMYEAIAGIMDDNKEPMRLRDLMATARNQAEVILASKPKDRKDPATTDRPWRKIDVFLTNLLTVAGVVHDAQGAPIPPGFGSPLAVIHSLAPDWQIKADAEIVLVLLGEMNDVSQNDIHNLSGMLYHSRSDEMQERALQVVTHLLRGSNKTSIS